MNPVAAPSITTENGSAASSTERFARDVLPYAYALLRKARQLTRNDADAEDLTQETLLRAYAGFERLRPDSNGVSPLEWWGLGPEPYGRGVSFPVLGWAIA